MRRRLAKTAVRAFVLPGINGQTVSLEMVVRTREIVSVTLGAVANSLAFVGHVFRSKRGSHHDRSWRPWRSNAAKGYLDRYDAENRPPNIEHRDRHSKSEPVHVSEITRMASRLRSHPFR
jgi:hypothetical protein